MASTQEMQRRARERRKCQEYIDAMQARFEEWTAVATEYDRSGRLSFQTGTSQQLLTWYDLWRQDYMDIEKNNNAQPLDQENADRIAEAGQFVLIKLDGEAVGFMMTKTRTDPNLNQETLGIEVMYVQPQYRGRHLATLGYNFAVRILKAKWIELSYDRVKGRESYWASLGFIWIAGSGNIRQNDGTYGSICILSQVDTQVGVLLHSENVYKTLKQATDYTLEKTSKMTKTLDFA